jgi:indolepyruvate ferredoxin oxidoreductase beta subunit
MEYPKQIVETFKKYFNGNVYIINGLEIALEIGDSRTINIVMLGFFSNFFNFKEEIWEKNLLKHIPKKVQELNLTAFRRGRKSILGGKLFYGIKSNHKN